MPMGLLLDAYANFVGLLGALLGLLWAFFWVPMGVLWDSYGTLAGCLFEALPGPFGIPMDAI